MAANIMVRGADILGMYPGFRFIGRRDKLDRISSILVRKRSNSVLLVGPGGAGCTALLLGLQALRTQPDAPFDLVAKRFFWLDTDALFAPGDHAEIDGAFKNAMNILDKAPDSVLVIKDTRDFIEGARNTGHTHFVNAITAAVRTGRTQVILECRDDDLDFVLKWHSNIGEAFTMFDLPEPSNGELVEIVRSVCEGMSKFHNVSIPDAAVDVAVDLTTKHRSEAKGLARAQPDRALTLLDRALASYRLEAHRNPPAIQALRHRMASMSGQQRDEAATELGRMEADWVAKQAEIRKIWDTLREGETAIAALEDEILQTKEAERVRAEHGEAAPKPTRLTSFGAMASVNGLESGAVQDIRRKIRLLEDEVATCKRSFEAIKQEVDSQLELDVAMVMREFSAVSGISVSKLGEDDRETLRQLEGTLSSRVFGQADAVKRIADAVKTGRVGKRNRDRPQASFLLMGPSGVGKTEIAKAMAFALLGEDKALTRFDMSEYSEKHAVSKLIGAPPGYEGFEAGGILTNAMRKNRKRVLLFDEIEKAHPAMFDPFLQILSDGRLTDNVGREVFFNETVIIMTTNTGQPHFLDRSLSTEEAMERAMADLAAIYRPEFLNRFAGRQNIVCFRMLDLASIKRIVRREIDDLDSAYAPGIRTSMPDADLDAFCTDCYDPTAGARGLPGWIQANLEPALAGRALEAIGSDVPVRCEVTYDQVAKRLVPTFADGGSLRRAA